MTDLDQLLHLIRRDGLASIRPGSKDPLATHSEHFAKALARYLAATQATYADAVQRGGAIDMSIVEEPANHYELVAMLYAPGLVGALAAQVVVLARIVGNIEDAARGALSAADSKGAVAWRDALQMVLTEIGSHHDG